MGPALALQPSPPLPLSWVNASPIAMPFTVVLAQALAVPVWQCARQFAMNAPCCGGSASAAAAIVSPYVFHPPFCCG